jgi:ABC-2 type transport system permease protein
MFMFIGLGILFGSYFSDKAAPGISSIVITMAGFLSGAWINVDPQSTLGTIYKVLPFYPAIFAVSVFAFRRRITSDNA